MDFGLFVLLQAAGKMAKLSLKSQRMLSIGTKWRLEKDKMKLDIISDIGVFRRCENIF